MPQVRPAAVAGTFYDGDAALLREQVRQFIASGKAVAAPQAKALIAPHAGYIYSGPVAGSAYASIRGLRDQVRRVVLIGPAHRVYVPGVAASSARAFTTPLGDVALAHAAIDALVQRFRFVEYADPAHALEHALEVQLPFLQTIFSEFEIIPLAVGDAKPDQVEMLLEELWGGAETLIVVSSDLSHYHDYETARALDRQTSDWITALQPGPISSDRACGQIPICGLLGIAAKRGLQAKLLDLRNSGDTAGPKSRVVGYGAYVFHRHTN